VSVLVGLGASTLIQEQLYYTACSGGGGSGGGGGGSGEIVGERGG